MYGIKRRSYEYTVNLIDYKEYINKNFNKRKSTL